MTTFTINGLAYDYDAEALLVRVDSPHYERAYECLWSPDRDSLVVVKHWQNDCVDQVHELPLDEAWQLYRFLDASDDVAESYARLRHETMPAIEPRRTA
jgi:hypothetical protein